MLTVPIPADYNGYSGVCNSQYNSFNLKFWNNWTLEFNYTISSDRYQLSKVQLSYLVKNEWFPGVNPAYEGDKQAIKTGLADFSATKGSSYRCNSKTIVDLDSTVSFEVTHYQGEPFYVKDPNKEPKFHTGKKFKI